jgi:hypothetical protein
MKDSIEFHLRTLGNTQRSECMETVLPIKEMVRAFFVPYGAGVSDCRRLPSQMGLGDSQIGRCIPFFALLL